MFKFFYHYLIMIVFLMKIDSSSASDLLDDSLNQHYLTAKSCFQMAQECEINEKDEVRGFLRCGVDELEKGISENELNSINFMAKLYENGLDGILEKDLLKSDELKARSCALQNENRGSSVISSQNSDRGIKQNLKSPKVCDPFKENEYSPSKKSCVIYNGDDFTRKAF
ncbi:MAG: hypothetical protein Q8S21_06595 [Candidatus Paracaedibacteraceae bacterium]|nr:hypothetical protein [Candidatus Paracaedibacteraceae bacterium]